MSDISENFNYTDASYSEVFEETWNLGEERKLEPRVVLYAIALLMQNSGIETAREYLLSEPEKFTRNPEAWGVPYEKRDINRPDRVQEN